MKFALDACALIRQLDREERDRPFNSWRSRRRRSRSTIGQRAALVAQRDTSKMGLVAEADESFGWLEFIEEARLLNSKELPRLIASRELVAIMPASYGTARENQRRRKPGRSSGFPDHPRTTQSSISITRYQITRLSIYPRYRPRRSTTIRSTIGIEPRAFEPACSSAVGCDTGDARATVTDDVTRTTVPRTSRQCSADPRASERCPDRRGWSDRNDWRPGNVAGRSVDRLGPRSKRSSTRTCSSKPRVRGATVGTRTAATSTCCASAVISTRGVPTNRCRSRVSTPVAVGRPSVIHFLNPPSSTAAASCPSQRNIHQRRLAYMPLS